MKEENKANVWKIGSRWSHIGDKKRSILDIFFKTQVVFFGDNQGHTTNHIEIFKDKVQEGDYFVIADGLKIKAVAKVIKGNNDKIGGYLQTFDDNITEKIAQCSNDIFDFNHETGSYNAYGWYVTIHSVSDEILSKKTIKVTRQRIYKMNKYANEVIDLYNS